ncbi:hypothetical protein [Demequina globuliformis]|uniref:hypothetical protein n=1 Tax=Demequina globuliformis TaxID=676202 RepID=UPI0007827FC1|nr:hypothetical protein [Demequina globuliformis]
MGSLQHPVGDQPPQVYWFRRVLVLVVLIAIIVGGWFLVSALTGGDNASTENGTPATSGSPEPTVTTSTGAASLEDPSQPCTADDVTVAAVASPESPEIGTMPAFDLSIKHTGISACTLSTDADGTELAISSGNDQYYSTNWCPEDPGFESKEWILQPEDSEALQVVWPGIWQNEECGGPVGDVRPGTYNAAISVAGITADVVPFAMVEAASP